MEIRNLITFQKIIELGSFSEAANFLSYSQSTVTMQMKQLENELGVMLFNRIGRKISITNEGLRFSKYALIIINASQNAIEDLSSDTITSGKLRIGILESICATHLPNLLNQFHNRYPSVTTIIKIGTFDELAQMLNTSQIDILWIFDNLIKTDEWINAYTYASPIAVVCSPQHNLAHCSHLLIKDLAEQSYILTENDCSYRSNFLNMLSVSGITPNIILEIGSTEIIKKFIESNLGITVLPEYTIKEDLAAGSLCKLALSDFDYTMYGQLFYHKNKWLSSLLKNFIAFIKEEPFLF